MADFSNLNINEHTYVVKDAWVREEAQDLRTDVGNLQTGKEDVANKVNSLTSSSTVTQYPSAKAVWDFNNMVYISYTSPVYNDITALVAAGKTPYTYDDTNKVLLIFTRTYNYMHHFTGLYYMEGTLWMKDRAVNQSNAWANRGTCTFVKTISSSSTNEQFPSAKAVYDYVNPISTALDTLTTTVSGKQDKLYRHHLTITYSTGSLVAQANFDIINMHAEAYTAFDKDTIGADLNTHIVAATGSFDDLNANFCILTTASFTDTSITCDGYISSSKLASSYTFYNNDIQTISDTVGW